MEKNRKNKKVQKIVKLTAFYAAATFTVMFCILLYLNSTVVFARTDSGTAQTATPGVSASASLPAASGATAAPSASQQAVLLSGVPAGAQYIYFSHDDKYCTYMDGQQLYIVDMSTGKTVQTILDEGIQSPVLMNDRNILMYFTLSGSTLTLHTYNLDNGQTADQTSFDLPSGAGVKSVDYSNATSRIFINIERTRNGAEKDTVYSIDIMKKLQKLSLTGVIDNMVLLENADSLYYNDEQNNLYLYDKTFDSLQKGKLLGQDKQDRVYVLSSSGSSVYVIENEGITNTIALPDAGPERFYTDKNNVYAVYGDHIVKISGDVNSTMQFNGGLQFLGTGGANAYFRQPDGSIIGMQSGI